MKVANVIPALTLIIGGCVTASGPAANSAGAPLSARAHRVVRILVVGDGFEAQHESYFVRHFVLKTKAAFDALPGASVASVDVKPAFVSSPKTGTSMLNLGYDKNQKPCPFKWDRTTLGAIAALSPKGFVPDLYLVVLGGNEGSMTACADGIFMFAREQDVAVNKIVHELGHSVAGLLDERGFYPGPPPKCIQWRNCSTEPMQPPWTFAACNLYDKGIYHAAETCRMNSDKDDFCTICKPFIEAALRSCDPFGPPIPPSGGCEDGPAPPAQPWQKAVAAAQGIRVVAVIDEQNRIDIIDAREAEPCELQPEVITGDSFVVAVDERNDVDEIVGIAPLPVDLGSFTARAYDPHPEVPETPLEVSARVVRITVLGVTLESVLNREIRLELRRLPDARKFFRVDDRTAAELRFKGFEGHRYDFQEAFRRR
jgi:hypothetical protein